MRPNVSHLIPTAKSTWKNSSIAGIRYIPLHTDASERSGTILFQMAPKAVYPKHRHPGTEEIYVLKGQVQAGTHTLGMGDYLFSPPSSVHELFSETGCLFLSIATKPIEIVPTGTQDQFDDKSLITR